MDLRTPDSLLYSIIIPFAASDPLRFRFFAFWPLLGIASGQSMFQVLPHPPRVLDSKPVSFRFFSFPIPSSAGPQFGRLDVSPPFGYLKCDHLYRVFLSGNLFVCSVNITCRPGPAEGFSSSTLQCLMRLLRLCSLDFNLRRDFFRLRIVFRPFPRSLLFLPSTRSLPATDLSLLYRTFNLSFRSSIFSYIP